jgi:hypothetical protein
VLVDGNVDKEDEVDKPSNFLRVGFFLSSFTVAELFRRTVAKSESVSACRMASSAHVFELSFVSSIVIVK